MKLVRFVPVFGVILTLLVLAACTPTSTPGPTSTPAFWPTGVPRPTQGPTAVPLLRPADRASCQRQGGYWQQQNTLNIPRGCYEVPAADAGKPCSDGSECQGWCDPNLGSDLPGELCPDWFDRVLHGQSAGGCPPLMVGTCSRNAFPNPINRLLYLEGGELHVLLARE